MRAFWLAFLLMTSIHSAPAAGATLGATLLADKRSTTFGLFAPRATKVTLRLFETPEGGKGRELPMRKGRDGTWTIAAGEAGAGTYYEFSVDGPKGPAEYFDPSRPVSDPYARANYRHNGRSIVIDPAFDWGASASFAAPQQKDAIVYEMHVKDFTFHPSSGVTDPKARGKYLGLADPKSIARLGELGVNVVELLPVHEFDNASSPNGVNHWGYMTTHFFAPESSYASGLHGEAVRELKTAIKALHEAGIAVVLDVVYNHTAEAGADGPVYNLRGIDNKLYYRLTKTLEFQNGTGCGNELASERPAVRRLILDSCKQWVSEYRVDGFRFDLGAGLDKPTMIAVQDTLPSGTLLFAEPWTADWSRKQWVREDLRGSRWGFWNDSFRDPVKRFVKGAPERPALMKCIAGSCASFAARPSQSVNYVECHDNETLDDHLEHDVRRNHLAAVIVLTSQGVPMLHEGQELRKSKRGNHNSYDQDNDVNWIDWNLEETNRASFEFYKGLIALRRNNTAFRQSECLGPQTVQWLQPRSEQTLGYWVRAPGDDPNYLVLLNAGEKNAVAFPLPMAGKWEVVCDGEKALGEGSLGTVSGTCKVLALTGVILRQPRH